MANAAAVAAAAEVRIKITKAVFDMAFGKISSSDEERYACVTYGWTGNDPEVKYKGSRDGATEAYNTCGAYSAIIVDRCSREILAEKSSPAGGRKDIDKLIAYSKNEL